MIKFLFKRKKFNSINDLFKEFNDIVTGKSIERSNLNLILHVATRKYLASIEDLHYTTGSKSPYIDLCRISTVMYSLLN